MTTVNLGDRVKDRVSGFTGIVVAKTQYLNGCTRVTLQPAAIDDGAKLPACETFDEPTLLCLDVGAVQIGPRDVGGPAKYPDVRHY
jgi:hypothetical protein